MQIQAGTRLGPYEIVAPIGAGGMGQVWRAKDTRLERDVAVKLLPEDYAAVSGEEVVIARDNRPLLRLVPLPPVGGRRQPGSAKGRIWMALDFDRTPEDFEDYVG